jgi:hypothetical protein
MIFRVWTSLNKHTENVAEAYKLSTTEATRSLSCRVRKSVNSAMQHLAWLLIGNNCFFFFFGIINLQFLGTTSFLTLGWLIKRRSKQHEDNENTYKDFIHKITNLLEDQYEEHTRDPETKPWLAISHIRDMLVPAADRLVIITLRFFSLQYFDI